MKTTILRGVLWLASAGLLQPMGCGGIEGDEDWTEGDDSVSEDDLAARAGGQTASISLDQADPHLGDWVTFTTSGGRYIQVACYGLGLEVIWAADQAIGTEFLLGGTDSIWRDRGGSADCYAWLLKRDFRNGALAHTIFTAGGVR